MEFKDLIIKDFNLNIKIVEVNNKKLSKSLLDQLPEHFPFNSNAEFIGDKIFGYIKIKNGKQSINYLLFVKENKVYKSDLTFLKNIAQINLLSKYFENQTITNFIFFRKRKEDFIDDNHLDCDSFNELYAMNYKTTEVFNENGKSLINDTKKNASSFLIQIKDLQIFI